MHSIIYSFIHAFIHSFIHSCISSFLHSFIHSINQSILKASNFTNCPALAPTVDQVEAVLFQEGTVSCNQMGTVWLEISSWVGFNIAYRDEDQKHKKIFRNLYH